MDGLTSNAGAHSEPPGFFDIDADIPPVFRGFAFLDLCAFTEFTEAAGNQAANAELRRLRLLCRGVCSHRGVRISKWLGDGVMLVGVDPVETLAAAVELTGRYRDLPLELRGGLACGEALMLEADDYAGRPVNLAARLCSLARPGEVLIDSRHLANVPEWMELTSAAPQDIRGLGRVDSLMFASLNPGVDLGGPVEI